MNVADQKTFPDRDISQTSTFETEDGERYHDSDSGMRRSPRPESGEELNNEAESYGNKTHEDSRQVNDGTHYEAVGEDVQHSSKLSESVGDEGKGGVKGWITNKLLGGGKPEPHLESQDLDIHNDAYDVAKTAEGAASYGSSSGSELKDEIVMGSESAVRSVSEEPASSSITSRQNDKPEHAYENKAQESEGL